MIDYIHVNNNYYVTSQQYKILQVQRAGYVLYRALVIAIILTFW